MQGNKNNGNVTMIIFMSVSESIANFLIHDEVRSKHLNKTGEVEVMYQRDGNVFFASITSN